MRNKTKITLIIPTQLKVKIKMQILVMIINKLSEILKMIKIAEL